MANLDNTIIHGSLNVKDKITITEEYINLILPKENLRRFEIGDEKYAMDIECEAFNVYSKIGIDLTCEADFDLSTLNNMTLESNKTLMLSANRIVLQNHGNLYGTEDPNDMDLSDIKEGTLYFRILED